MRMRFDETNAAGGINGRKIRLVVEDSGYDPKKGVLAAQKLVQRDKVFAVVSTIGSPVMMATMPLFLERNVLTSSRRPRTGGLRAAASTSSRSCLRTPPDREGGAKSW